MRPDWSITAAVLSSKESSARSSSSSSATFHGLIVTRLNDFYFQFQRIAANYNQGVKVVNAHFSNVSIPHQIAALEQRTRELKALSLDILNLAKCATEWLRI